MTSTLKRSATPVTMIQTTSIIDTPIPSVSITNKPANSKSLYHTCRSVLDKLALVEGMPSYLDSDNLTLLPTPSSMSSDSPSGSGNGTSDPLSKLWSICRLGSPLSRLFNALDPAEPLKEDQRNLPVNESKKIVYHFIVACRKQLGFSEDEVFTLSDLYKDNTNGFVKVINTINMILSKLEDKGVICVRSTDGDSYDDGPKDTRDKVVVELLETERKYVQDLEILQNYMHELQLQEILPPDTVHYLFGNLNSLVDFQRRFLIHLEEIAEKSGQEQNFGSLFSQLEDQFTVYEPYCSNYFSAQDLVKQEAPKLQKLANILNPVYELPSMLIKPVQRICKYPLLMQQLIKSTPQEWPHVAEMEEGLESVKRVTEKVNETQRKHENIQVVETLKRRLEEVRGSLIDSFGSLLLQEKLRMTSSDENDKEMHVFFFEKTVLICKETKDATKGKPAKSSMSIKKKRRASLQPKGLINIRKILGVQNRSESGSWTLAIEWRDREVDRLFFRFRNEELLKLWEGTLKRVMAPPKTTVSNTQLASMKSPTLPPTVPDSLRVEDEDNSVERHYDAEEDEAYQRARSNSLSAQLLNSITGRPKLPRNVNSENSYKPSRPYQSIPRSNSSTGTSLSQEYYYPASPPPSGPSSPTNSSRASQASSSSSIRQRDASPLVDIATKFMTADTATNAEEYRQLSRPPPPPHINRSQSHTVSSPFGSTQTPQHLYQPPSSRLRSQSSPNIHNKTPPATQWDDAPQLPISSRTLYQAPPSPLDSLKESNSYRTTMSSSTGSSLSRSSDMHVPHSPALLPGMLKIKINYNDGIYVVMSPLETTYPELMDKVEKKVRLIGNLQTNAVLRLRYEDEDGDLITINSDEDVQMAFESRGSVTAINLYVSA